MENIEDSDFWVDIKDISIGPSIGSGNFGSVFVGKYFGDLVAVKKQIRDELRELSVLKIANHESLVSYLGAFNENDEGHDRSFIYIITELCVGGDLLTLLVEKPVKLSWPMKFKMVRQIASGIEYLHQKNLIHRDIKSSNILIGNNWVCKIGDFGLARIFCTTPGTPKLVRRMTICGTHEYMAPEELFDEEYSQSVDIFSFGMVILELIKEQQVGRNGYVVRKPQEKFVIDVEAVREMIPKDTPPSLFSLAEQCINYESCYRPAIEEILDWIVDLQQNSPTKVSTALPPLPSILTKNEEMRRWVREIGAAGGVLGGTINDEDAESSTVYIEARRENTTLTKEDLQIGYELHKLYETITPLSQVLRTSSLPRPSPSSGGNVIRKSGYLYKRNDTGFRNWKQTICTLTDDSFLWKSKTDPHKRCFFNLKHCNVMVVNKESNRFLIVETTSAEELQGGGGGGGIGMVKSRSQSAAEGGIAAVGSGDGSNHNTHALHAAAAAIPIRAVSPEHAGISHQHSQPTPPPLASSHGNGEHFLKRVSESFSLMNRSPSVLPPANPPPAPASRPVGGYFSSMMSISTAGTKLISPTQLLSHSVDIVESTVTFQKEFAATSAEEMYDWIDAIQEVIHDLNAAAHAEHCAHQWTYLQARDGNIATGGGGDGSDSAIGSAGGVGEDEIMPWNDEKGEFFRRNGRRVNVDGSASIAEWLESLDFSAEYVVAYEQLLFQNGFSHAGLIFNAGGLTSSDLDTIGIRNEFHRRVFLNNMQPVLFSKTLRVAVVAWCCHANGNVLMLKLLSRWRHSRTCIDISWMDLMSLDKALRMKIGSLSRRSMQGNDFQADLLLPPFPSLDALGSVSSSCATSAAAGEQRHHSAFASAPVIQDHNINDIEVYLITLIKVLHSNTSLLEVLLVFFQHK